MSLICEIGNARARFMSSDQSDSGLLLGTSLGDARLVFYFLHHLQTLEGQQGLLDLPRSQQVSGQSHARFQTGGYAAAP